MADINKDRQHTAALKPSQRPQGCSSTDLLFHALHGCLPEEADLSTPITMEFTTQGLRTKLTFERTE